MKLSTQQPQLLLARLIIALALTLAATANNNANAHSPGENALPTPKLSGAELAKRLTIEPARAGKEFARITLPAEVVLAPQADHQLAPSMDGKLVKWLIQPGTTIEIGQPLAELVAPELTDLRASETELNQLVKERQKLVDSLQEQVDLGVQSITALQEAQAGLSEARARLQNIRSQAASRKELGVAPGPQNSSRWTWVATVAGTVANIQCSPGQRLDPQTLCITILNTNAPQVRVDVPQRLLTGGHNSNTIDNSTALFSALGQDPADNSTRQQLVWTRKSPVIDPQSRTQSHYFTLADSTENTTKLLPGTAGRITLLSNVDAPNIVLVPRLAVTLIENQPHVFIWHEDDGDADPIPVKIIGQFDADVLIQGDGLTRGAPIVTHGVFLLKSQLILGEDDHKDHEDHQDE